MKSLIVAMMLIAGPAMAQINVDETVSSRPDDYQVDILSWCDGNSVLSQDAKGDVYVRANCSEQNMVCKTYEMFRLNRTIFTAACVNQ